MSLDQPDPRALARLLIRRKGVRDGPDPSQAAACAACEAACRGVARWVGPLGADALFSRAMVTARESHPALAGIELDRAGFALAGVDESIRIHGEAPTVAGIETLLVAVIALLSRLVGGELAERLVTTSPANTEST